MKTFLTLSISFFFLILSAQDISADIKTLQSMVDNEEYFQAMGFADKLIGQKIKEGGQQNAGKVYLLRGIAKYKLELEVDAIVDFKIAKTLDSRNFIAFYYIADIYYAMSSYSSALENVIYFLNNNNEDVNGLILKSKCELEMGNSNAAKMTIQKALALYSSNPELYYIRAVINSQLGEDKLACKDIKIAARFGYEGAKDRVDSFCHTND